ncbi:putative ABC transporter ATP-binding protein YxlF [Pseudovibrio axinellae]|uniref:Putative ABC transporter ATP-binding protein YxlF n=1 Tax=Pseudovibrio axinellae TaxID=989403 RepID=A0A165T1A7_9HYPH|nr:ABC transporter ATP-binding protein [Pseudovibrio axinellae]KZL05160.1 putative ABC transporter ATP-binding protein YxlF [Pseudovibrio axinellae]SER50526.1 Cu-processing system ATP-binding protein [Pseudovibrio axinellae]
MTLDVHAATVRRGKLETLSQVSLSVAEGERVALIGHNGAGKSTLMKAVLGLVPLFSGEISILGEKPGSKKARKTTAYLPESVSFHPALTGREMLYMLASMKGDKKAVDPLLERVGLAHAANRRISTYSKGMRQRVGLAQALLARPRLAILDEPTSGLDPLSRGEFYQLVDEMAADGTAVMISSHALTELEAKTDRIAVLRQGQLVANDTLSSLRRDAGLPIRVRVTTKESSNGYVAEQLGGVPVNGQSVELTCTAEHKLKLLGRIAEMENVISDVDLAPPCLDDLYKHFSEEVA